MSVPHSFGPEKEITSCNQYSKDEGLPQAYLSSPAVKRDLCLTCRHARHLNQEDGVMIVPCERRARKEGEHGQAT